MKEVKLRLCKKHMEEAKKAVLPMTLFAHAESWCFQCNHLKNKQIIEGEKHA